MDGAIQARTPKDERPKEKAKPKGKANSAASSFRTEPTSISQRGNDLAATQFKMVWTQRHSSIARWLKSVFDPLVGDSGVPNAAGSFELYTDLWQVVATGSATSGPDGNAWVAVCADSWIESGNANGTPTGECRVVGTTTGGNLALSTDGTFALANFPAVGGAVPAGLSITVQPLPNTSYTSNTRGRLVGTRLVVWNDDSALATKGEIAVITTVNPAGGILGGRINGCSMANIVNSNKYTMSYRTASLPNWKSGEVMSCVALPAEAMAYDMINYPTTGYTNVPFFTVAAFAQGMEASEKFMWRIEQLFESEANISNKVEKERTPVVQVSGKELKPYLAAARPYAVGMPSAQTSIVPFVETLFDREPSVAYALNDHPMMKGLPKSTLAGRPSGGFIDTIKDIGSSLATAAKTSGVLKQIPFVGGFLDKAAQNLGRIFGF